jgi:hypothetical protein
MKMRKALIPAVLALAVLAAGCFPIDFVSAPGDGDPGTTLPLADRLPVYVDSVDILLAESWPVQVRVLVKGNLPNPCHALAWDLGEPDADGRIVLDLYSTADLDQVCVEMLQGFEQTIALGSFTSGSYVLVVNGVEYPFTI